MKKKKEKKEKKNWLEWAITIFSGILVFLTLGFLIYQMIYEERTPPDITVTLGAISKKDDGFSIPVKVKNKGTSTAENLKIEVRANHGEREEKAAITFSYLPGNSETHGWVTFSEKPDIASLKTHVVGYITP